MVGTVFTINLDDVAHTGMAVREIGRMGPAGMADPCGRVDAPAGRSLKSKPDTANTGKKVDKGQCWETHCKQMAVFGRTGQRAGPRDE